MRVLWLKCKPACVGASCALLWADGVQVEPDSDLAAQPAADYEVDQRMNW